MAIDWIIEDKTDPVSGLSTAFTTSGRGFFLHGKRFGSGEYGRVVRVGQDEAITNNAGPIEVSASPNTVFIDAPAGDYQLIKSSTALAASLGVEEVE